MDYFLFASVLNYSKVSELGNDAASIFTALLTDTVGCVKYST